jgi:hypothetical protein
LLTLDTIKATGACECIDNEQPISWEKLDMHLQQRLNEDLTLIDRYGREAAIKDYEQRIKERNSSYEQLIQSKQSDSFAISMMKSAKMLGFPEYNFSFMQAKEAFNQILTHVCDETPKKKYISAMCTLLNTIDQNLTSSVEDLVRKDYSQVLLQCLSIEILWIEYVLAVYDQRA